ncbi:MAG: hypothetical protein AAGK97_06440, partial [Bacteroidota bacterium]
HSKIIKVDRLTGEQSDFITSHEYGYSPGVGVYIDNEQNHLYAIGGYFFLKDSLSSLFKFNLETGDLIQRYDMENTGAHFINDLIPDRNGNFYITNTKDSSIYLLRNGSDQFEFFFKSTEIQYPNGIAISDDNSKLYIATYSKGVRTLDIKTKKIINDIDTSGMSAGIDGLEFYNGNLFGLQYGVQANSHNFRKLILDESQSKVIDIIEIDANNPELDLPLTFCIHDNQAVAIANSNIQYLDQRKFTFATPDSIELSKLKVYDLSNYWIII